MSEGIAPTHDERVADRLAELQAERDAAVSVIQNEANWASA